MPPNQQFSTLVENCSLSLRETTAVLLNDSSRDSSIHHLISLQDILKDIRNIFCHIFDFTLSEPKDVFPVLNWIEDGRGKFFEIFNDLASIEVCLLKILDDVEKQISEGYQDEKFEALFTAVENCSSLSDELKKLLNSSRPIFDTTLEFKEVYDDHLKSLDAVIDENLKLCSEIRSQSNDFLNQQIPELNLDQLVLMLASNLEATRIKVPTFSNLDKCILQKYFTVAESINPIEKSLIDILLPRINEFERREILNSLRLYDVLEKRYSQIKEKFQQLNDDIHAIKKVVVDTRWETLFTNLYVEVKNSIVKSKKMLSEIKTDNRSPNKRKDVIKTLRHERNAIDKSFDIFHQAIVESSLVTLQLAENINNLGAEWVSLQRSIDLVTSSEKRETSELISQLSRITLNGKNDGNSLPSRNPKHLDNSKDLRKVGALLFKRMNIHPIIVKNSPKSAKKDNTLYRNDWPRNAVSRALRFKPIPDLGYVDKENGDIEPKEISYTLKREKELISHYRSQKSRIPRLNEESRRKTKRCAMTSPKHLNPSIKNSTGISMTNPKPLRNTIPRPTLTTALLASSPVDPWI